MKGFVPTPDHVVDLMVTKLFAGAPPRPDSRILDPGCGTGAFIRGLIRWCRKQGLAMPRIVGIESDAGRLPEPERATEGLGPVSILHQDFLAPRDGKFDYIVGNPPYVPITGLTPTERDEYRKRYSTAVGRFDLYLLFFEQALRLLGPGGRLVFVRRKSSRTSAPRNRSADRSLSFESRRSTFWTRRRSESSSPIPP